MKTKTAKRKPKTAKQVIKGLKTARAKPVLTIPEAAKAIVTAVDTKVAELTKPEEKVGFADLYQARGGRMWFQVAATPELRAKVEALKAKRGKRTLNDLMADILDEAMRNAGL